MRVMIPLVQDAVHKLPDYYSRFGSAKWTVTAGGRYKESSTVDLPGTTISAILVELAPGGMREPHWHDPNEWAYVIKGTCRCA